MATMTMDLPMTPNSSTYGAPMDMPNDIFNDILNIRSEDLNRLIESDITEYGIDDSCWRDYHDGDDKDYAESEFYDLYEPFIPWGSKSLLFKETNGKQGDEENSGNAQMPLDILEFDQLVMVNPITGLPTTQAEEPDEDGLQEPPKPYHPNIDHAYMKKNEEVVASDKDSTESDEAISGNDEQIVEVWEIDSFKGKEEPPALDPVPKFVPSYPSFKRETRRTSSRTIDTKRREQAISNAVRDISNAVNASFKKDRRPRRIRFKNIKPKNSVETTPYQSDMTESDEFYSQPVRPTYTKMTKKKTSKGRIDHSESERKRREVLRRNFNALRNVIPDKFLRGDKVSSQISKQKILNGAKAFLEMLYSTKAFYRSNLHSNHYTHGQLQKCLSKFFKFVDRRK